MIDTTTFRHSLPEIENKGREVGTVRAMLGKIKKKGESCAGGKARRIPEVPVKQEKRLPIRMNAQGGRRGRGSPEPSS